MLEARDIHKTYSNASKTIAVLKGIDLKIGRGNFVAIVGPSGAGKSTLLHLLGGLDAPTRGKVILEGEDIYRLSDAALSAARNKKIGFVFQFYHLLPEFTVLENVLMPALIGAKRKAQSAKLKEEALRLLGEVGLSARTSHFPHKLSGGEQQRVAIARGLINKPQLLLCDEPTGNLDSSSGSQVLSLLKKINAQDQMAVVLVTHNLELALASDRIYHLQDGVLN